MLKLFNTLARKKEVFKPIGKVVGFYSCGPTVYWHMHIGNMRAYIFSDTLKRILLYDKFKVKHVMNYTDVGHLTSDADEGEDKVEKAAKKEKKTAKEITKFYAAGFEDDCKKLNIIPADVICKATEHIKEQLELVEKLEEEGYTYSTTDGIYFDTSKFKDYGKLGRTNVDGLEAGKRVAVGEKKNKTDFALWKFSQTPGERQQEWKSKWGVGFPGWHIECTAMSSKYLGEQFDIHTGGEDHIQVHHTNEIAQAEAGFGKKPWVKYWLHVTFLTNKKGEKISKSKGGLYTVSELEEKGFKALSYRYFCLGTHYRKRLNFSLSALENSQNTFERLKTVVIELKSKKDSNKTKDYDKYKKDFQESIDDDLNTPLALSALWNVLRDKKLGSKEKLELAYDFDEVLGLGLKDAKEEKVKVSDDIEKLIKEREEARKNKDYDKADKIRDKLKEKGIVLEDTPQGVKWKRV